MLTCATLKDTTPPNFAEKTYANSHKKNAKFAKVFSLESFQLYGMSSFEVIDFDNGISIHSLLQIFLPKIIVMYSLAVIGGTFYLSKFPEKWFPGIQALLEPLNKT